MIRFILCLLACLQLTACGATFTATRKQETSKFTWKPIVIEPSVRSRRLRPALAPTAVPAPSLSDDIEYGTSFEIPGYPGVVCTQIHSHRALDIFQKLLRGVSARYREMTQLIGVDIPAIGDKSPCVSYPTVGLVLMFREILVESDETIAFVLAHEIGHVVRGITFKESDIVGKRHDELEADFFAVQLSHKAGFDAGAIARSGCAFLQKHDRLLAARGLNPESLKRDHPSARVRCAVINGALLELDAN